MKLDSVGGETKMEEAEEEVSRRNRRRRRRRRRRETHDKIMGDDDKSWT